MFTLHPNVYATGAATGLLGLLEHAWVRGHTPGDGTIYVVSGFANYNGGVRFYETFREHVDAGGQIKAFFAGSANARLSSKQVVGELLGLGANVCLINRKRLLHAKCYGRASGSGNIAVVSSGNFTGPGMSQNVEASVLLDQQATAGMSFSWPNLAEGLLTQKWDYYYPDLDDPDGPAWRLLYDEKAVLPILDETALTTMVLVLGHSDTVRIRASPGTRESRGTQYFWLSKDCFDFFPPLTIRNQRGHKPTYSCLITLDYADINVRDPDTRVTFEAGNNLDFRLGTSKLRGTGVANTGDLAVISRRTESEYEMRIVRQDDSRYGRLKQYAVSFVGARGKKYGFLANAEADVILGSDR